MSNKAKIKKFRVEKPSDAIVELSNESKDFINLGDHYKIDFNAWFVMFNMWLKLPMNQKEAVILQLIKDGKVEVNKDAGEDNKDK